MSIVLVNGLRVRTAPSVGAETVAYYDAGQVINSGDQLIQNEGRTWLRYTGDSGNYRYVCAIDKDGSKFIDVNINHSSNPSPNTGLSDTLRQSDFPDPRIRNWGCCFLCTCVKGGLTTRDQCMRCFEWGINSGKLRRNDCYVNCNKEEWAIEIASTFGTQYHGDYCFQSNGRHFWLTQNGIEIFNSAGIGWRG